MAGNSQRQGAIRKSKKGAQTGTGGHIQRGIKGKGPTPPAEARKGHPASRRAAAADRRTAAPRAKSRDTKSSSGGAAAELLVGRNPVAEALRAKIPATALYLAQGIEADERITESIRLASNRNLALLEISRAEMDRRTGNIVHQGIALQVPPFAYTELRDVVAAALDSGTAPLLVALDGVTDPRNLGAIIRSAVAFGAHGVIITERRSAGITPTAWRTSAGTAARLPVAQVTNLVRSLKECKEAGLFVVGLDADGTTQLDDLELATEPMVLVVGSEGRGLSRLAGENCDVTLSIPMAPAAESLIARRRRRG